MKASHALLVFASGVAIVAACSPTSTTGILQKEGRADLTRTDPVGCILTPAGYRPAALAHHIGAGHTIATRNGHVQELDPAGQIVSDFGAQDSINGVDATALCPLSTKSLKPETNASGVRPTFGTGFIAWAYWDRPTGQAITHDTAHWTVPAAPSSSNGQVIFLFNGLQTDSSIIQPVLQWGYSSYSGGGAYWAMACWYLQGASTYVTGLTSVSPGDNIVGTVDSNTVHGYTCHFTSPGGSNTLSVDSLKPEQTEAVLVLEAYGITACSDYPNTTLTAFTGSSIRTHAGVPSFSWTTQNRVTDCHQKAIAVSNANPGGEVDVYYRYPPPTASVSGPAFIDTKGTYAWTVTAGGGSGSYTYQWVYRPDGGSNTSYGTASTQGISVYEGDPNFWWIATVTSDSRTASDSIYVTNCIGVGGDCGASLRTKKP